MQNRLRNGTPRHNLTHRTRMKITDMHYNGDFSAQCCDTDFLITEGDYEAKCPVCKRTLRIASLRRDWEEKNAQSA